MNLPFLEVIRQIPSYGKFLKEVLSRKRRLNENEVIQVERGCGVLIRDLPPKLRDLGSYSIPCTIGNINFHKALLDNGASV